MKLLYTAIILILFCSCHHKSELKHEWGIVIAKSYSPEFSGSGTGVGVTTRGSAVITTTEIHKEEQYVVVFRCEHNVCFSINRNDLFANLNEKDTVTIDYYDILKRDNSLYDYEFVTAHKRENKR